MRTRRAAGGEGSFELVGRGEAEADPAYGVEVARLVRVVAELSPEAADVDVLLASRGQHDDRHLRVATELAADVEAGAVWKHHVEQDEVRLRPPRLLERLLDRARHSSVEAVALERRSQGLGDRQLVF